MTLGQDIVSLFQHVKASRNAEELCARQGHFLYNELTRLIEDASQSARLIKYFEESWFCQNWKSNWVSYALNTATMQQAEFSTNNHSESNFSKFKAEGKRAKMAKTFAQMIDLCNYHLRNEDRDAATLLDEHRGQRNTQRTRNSPVVAAAIQLKEKQLLPLLQGNVTVTSKGVVFTLEYTTRVRKPDRVELQQHQHVLDTVAGETHCRCGLMDQLSGRPCVHLLAW